MAINDFFSKFLEFDVKAATSFVADKTMNDGRAIAITGVALLAISALVIGGSLLHVNAFAGNCLLGVGSTLLVGTLAAGVKIFIDEIKEELERVEEDSESPQDYVRPKKYYEPTIEADRQFWADIHYSHSSSDSD